MSVAAFIYLRRNPAAATHRFLIPPLSVTSAILLFGVVALIAINIELLTFADALTNTILLLVAPVVFLAGLLVARRLRTTRPPDVFARIGSFETHDS